MTANGQYDPRYKYTIYNIDSFAKLDLCTYAPNTSPLAPITQYWVAKYAPSYQFHGNGGDPNLNFGVNYIEIRLADTYLMEAEALVQGSGDQARAGQLLNAVRARVGLPAATVSLAAIKNERRMELATEGHRFFDLVRWGDANQVLNNMANGFSKHFTAGKNEILPIPLPELSNTQLKQNPGY
jgi:hypothetical protein